MNEARKEDDDEDRCLVVLITGVSKGLGRALALELAKRGHTIIGCSRNDNALHSLQSQLSAISTNQHFLFNLDVTSNSGVEDLLQAVLQKDLVPDILVNNAAIINEKSNIWEIPPQEFDSVIDTNIKGSANVLRHFIPLMIARDKKIIVNISSMWGRMGAPMELMSRISSESNERLGLFRKAFIEFSAYSASKWGIEGLTKSIAQELPKGMAIIALDPGVINTDMLHTSFGDLASNHQTPEHWAVKASTMILNFTSADNGASLSVDSSEVEVS